MPGALLRRPPDRRGGGEVDERWAYGRDVDAYRPGMSAARVAQLRRWHEAVSAEPVGARDVEYLGLQLSIPEQVFAPTPTSDLLGREVLARVRPGQRVLDMGCGSGANAILAARTSHDVTGVDVNPVAV